MTLTEKILKVLERVPVPILPQAAQIAEGIFVIVQEAHADAAAKGQPPPTLEEFQSALTEAAGAAAEPWKRIQQRAAGAAPATRDPRGHITTGSTGE